MKKIGHRKIQGMSLVEMLTTIMLMGIVAAAITDIAVTQNVIAFRTYNKIDALTNARRVASFIERDIHNARFIGYLPTAPGPMVPLSETTLVLQIPVFYSPSAQITKGFPAIPTPGVVPGTWNFDTVIYQVVGDTTRPGTGQFVIQKTIYPGLHPPIYPFYETAAVAVNQTILTGIVGPQDLTQNVDGTANSCPPAVFGYFSKQYPLYSVNSLGIANYQPGNPSTDDPSNFNGVSINLEVMSNAASKRIDLTPRSMAFRTEACVRGNYYSP
jgi:prepilin-type N-terminal cleavage/methylation domain-containing protein